MNLPTDELFDPWTWKMAWRDSRRSRGRLLLYAASMIAGVAALVALTSFESSLENTLQREARRLLGADVAIERDEGPVTEEALASLDSIPGRRAGEVELTTMARFPGVARTRLVQVHAIEGDYPFYGVLSTEPADADRRFRTGPYAVVDRTLMQQYGLSVGDSVRIGRSGFSIAGALVGASFTSTAASTLAPRIYISRSRLDTTLLGFGSQAEYTAFLALEDPDQAGPVIERLRTRADSLDWDLDTPGETAGQWTDALENLYSFLNLVGFVALLLGGLGVASAVHVYVRRKRSTIATLRCVGASSDQAFAVYLVQAIALGAGSAVLGTLLGLGAEQALPSLLSAYLPFEVQVVPSWRGVGLGLALGTGLTGLFALLPLVKIRRISPMAALRSSVEDVGSGWNVARVVVVILLIGLVALFAFFQTEEWEVGVGFTAAIVVATALLTLLARALRALVRRLVPEWGPYTLRQGLANLYRPDNQTTVLVLTLGMGTFLLSTLLITQQSLLSQIRFATSGPRPNLVMFDIQSDQIDGVVDSLGAEGVRVQRRVPLVSMHLAAINGRTVEEIEEEGGGRRGGWAMHREYRSTYRDSMIDTETLLRGSWTGRADAVDGPAPVSVAQEIVGDLNAELGDTLGFRVANDTVQTVVGSVREIEWRRLQPNFFVVFPTGVLEEAPQTYAVVARAASTEISARAQNAVISGYPNVSAIDLSLILETVDRLVGQQVLILRFMALLSLITGLIVLLAALSNSRDQRLRESVLLKTLGARRSQVSRIMFTEYALLGALSAAAGVVLAEGAAWMLGQYVFEIPVDPALGSVLLLAAGVAVATVVLGFLHGRGIYSAPAAETLRTSG